MSFEIHTADGRVLSVHTEVGNGLTQVVVTETEPQPEPMEASE